MHGKRTDPRCSGGHPGDDRDRLMRSTSGFLRFVWSVLVFLLPRSKGIWSMRIPEWPRVTTHIQGRWSFCIVKCEQRWIERLKFEKPEKFQDGNGSECESNCKPRRKRPGRDKGNKKREPEDQYTI